MRRAHLLPLLIVCAPAPARAGFDVVSAYHDKVKGFEAVYYLERSKTWARDRRVFETFAQLDALFGARTSFSAGVLYNHRPSLSNVQVGMFAIYNLVAPSDKNPDEQDTRGEALFGGRVSFDEILELTLGGYWRKGPAALAGQAGADASKRGSFFFELNSPMLFARSSYVVGIDSRHRLPRWDLRLDYDNFSWAESIAAGAVRYAFAEERWFGTVDLLRLGHPKFRFFSARARFSGDGLGWMQAGFDWVHQFSDDFNLTRRGHFGTSIGIKLMYSVVAPSAANFLGFATTTDHLHGVRAELSLQIPAKWFLTALVVFGAAAASQNKNLSAAERARLQRSAARMLVNTIERPKDILFCRLGLVFSYNDPETFALGIPPAPGVKRLFATFGLIY